MFKVICIDAKQHKNCYDTLIYLLKENETYTVHEIIDGINIQGEFGQGYWLQDFYAEQSEQRVAFCATRFMRISDIDETEFIREQLTEKV